MNKFKKKMKSLKKLMKNCNFKMKMKIVKIIKQIY